MPKDKDADHTMIISVSYVCMKVDICTEIRALLSLYLKLLHAAVQEGLTLPFVSFCRL
jgi:hypothetical protein